MRGKATLILTDKNTGRVVKKVEEHNMLTNALSDIFKLPALAAYGDSSSHTFFKGYMPIYEHLAKGVALFGDTIPENKDNYLFAGKYNIIATAGDAYADTDVTRGSFNANSSGETENGYRFVWDFAPEKALGTIKSISLTHRLSGNLGDCSIKKTDSSYLVNAYDASYAGCQSCEAISFDKGTAFAQIGFDLYAYYRTSASVLTIYKYRITNPGAVTVCGSAKPKLISTEEIAFPSDFSVVTSDTSFFYNPKTMRLYAIKRGSKSVNNVYHTTLRYCVIDPLGVDEPYFSDTIQTDVSLCSTVIPCALFDGKFYLQDSTRSVCVCSMSGVTVEKLDVPVYAVDAYFSVDGILAFRHTRIASTAGGHYLVHFLGEKPQTLYNISSSSFTPIPSDIIKAPYCLTTYKTALYVMIRADYMATINNLAAPLEKTDQHALQVRYEVFND